jgi:transposase
MRGADVEQGTLFSVVTLESRVPADHPLRKIRPLLEETLDSLDRTFERIYADSGRPSIPPERLIRASLLQVLYSIRSERQLMEQLDYNLLFRWFVGLTVDDPVWDHSTFSKNRERLIESGVARKILKRLLKRAKRERMLSSEHFSVDGTLLEAWAAVKGMRRRDGQDEPPPPGRNPSVDFHGQRRSNDTHVSPVDPESRLARKSNGQAAKLSYQGHVLMEHRNGLVVDVEVSTASGTAEREAALKMLDRQRGYGRRTLAGDKGYDTHGFVAALRERRITPQVAQNLKAQGGSAIDARTTRHAGYRLSQRFRKRIEECFGWGKQDRLLRRPKLRGRARIGWLMELSMVGYNMVRMSNLMAAPA